MLESWLLQLRLFPRQFCQTLQALAQRFLTAGVGLVMPLALFIGFSHGGSSWGEGRPSGSGRLAPTGAATAPEVDAWRNLIHPLVEDKPVEEPTREQCDHRGPMQERRAGRGAHGLPTGRMAEPAPVWVWLPSLVNRDDPSEPLFQLQPQTWTYQTLLPWTDPVL